MTGADVLVRVLAAEGVEQVFCFPLSGLMDALTAQGIRVITTRQERFAGNMAGRPVALDQRPQARRRRGPGACRAAPFAGVAHSYTDSTPILFLPGHPGLGWSARRPPSTAWPTMGPRRSSGRGGMSADPAAPRLRQAFAALEAGARHLRTASCPTTSWRRRTKAMTTAWSPGSARAPMGAARRGGRLAASVDSTARVVRPGALRRGQPGADGGCRNSWARRS